MSGDQDIRLVPVRTFGGGSAVMNAELARNILETEGIESIVPGDIAAETIPVVDAQVLVREEDARRAAEILAAYFDAPADEDAEGSTQSGADR